MEKFTFTNNRGEAIEFFGSPFRLIEARGLGDVSADIQSERAPFQDGDTYISTRFEPRYVELDFIISGSDYADIEEKRVLLSRVTNPKIGLGELKYEYGDTVRTIQAVAESVPVFPSGRSNRTEFRQVAGLSFKCPNPYWRTLSIDASPTFEPLFQFPFEGTFQMGIARDERILSNLGDTDIPFTVEFYGPALNPRIDNVTTGEFIKVNQELLDGEYMRITTADNNKKVVFVDEFGVERNVFNWIDIDSTFFKLIQGDNYITYSADSDIQGAIVNFTYQQHYNSV